MCLVHCGLLGQVFLRGGVDEVCLDPIVFGAGPDLVLAVDVVSELLDGRGAAVQDGGGTGLGTWSAGTGGSGGQ